LLCFTFGPIKRISPEVARPSGELIISYTICAFTTTVIQPSVSVLDVLLLMPMVRENNEKDPLVVKGPIRETLL
jgi:hypothetical protein